MRLTGLTTKVSVELCSFLETLGRIPVLAFPSFSSLPTFFGSWPLSRSSRPMAQHLQISLPGPCSRDTSSLPPSSKDPYVTLGPKGQFPPPRGPYLYHTCQVPLPREGTYSQVMGMRAGTTLGLPSGCHTLPASLEPRSCCSLSP